MADIAPVPVPTLVSARLRLRAYRADDVDGLFALYSDPAVMRFWSFPPWSERAQAQAHLERAQAHAAQGKTIPWVIAGLADDRFIGTATLHTLDLGQGRAEVGYALASAQQGRGLATEAVRAMLRHAFGTMGLQRLKADVDTRNLASCRLLESLGFIRERVLRQQWKVASESCDSAVYALLADEYDALSRTLDARIGEAAR